MELNSFIKLVEPYTMTSTPKIIELYNSLEYIRENNIDGDIIECGVWKGGNILGIIEYLNYHNMNKKVWLFDTFNGMTEPEDCDFDMGNNKAKDMMDIPVVFAFSPIDDVKDVLSKSKYNKDLIEYVIGDVSETLLNIDNIPEKISLLRLDTDWYKSTKDELIHLYPKLVDKGVLIVDDYGHWSGSRLAVDEFFKYENISIHEIDYTAIKIIKNENIQLNTERMQGEKIQLNTERMQGQGPYFVGDFQVNYLYGLNDLCEKYLKKDFTLLELGSNDGISTRLFSYFVEKVVCVDNNKTASMIDACSKYNNINFHHKSFIDFLAFDKDNTYDIIYIDGNHDFESIDNDIEQFKHKVKKGGYISGHDYNTETPGVKLAIEKHFPNEEVIIFSDSSWLIKII